MRLRVRGRPPPGFEEDITQAIPNGAKVEIDPAAERPFIRVL